MLIIIFVPKFFREFVECKSYTFTWKFLLQIKTLNWKKNFCHYHILKIEENIAFYNEQFSSIFNQFHHWFYFLWKCAICRLKMQWCKKLLHCNATFYNILFNVLIHFRLDEAFFSYKVFGTLRWNVFKIRVENIYDKYFLVSFDMKLLFI